MGNSEIPVLLDAGAFMPEKAHANDAGYDLRTPVSFTLKPNTSITIDLGVHMLIPNGYVGLIKSKSGLNTNHNITVEGVVDAEYTGSIKAKVYFNPEENCTPCSADYPDVKGNDYYVKYSDGNIYHVESPNAYTFERGDKLTQIVIVPILNSSLKQVPCFPKTDRGNLGFGSSGR